jgi:hypothetical protein
MTGAGTGAGNNPNTNSSNNTNSNNAYTMEDVDNIARVSPHFCIVDKSIFTRSAFTNSNFLLYNIQHTIIDIDIV